MPATSAPSPPAPPAPPASSAVWAVRLALGASVLTTTAAAAGGYYIHNKLNQLENTIHILTNQQNSIVNLSDHVRALTAKLEQPVKQPSEVSCPTQPVTVPAPTPAAPVSSPSDDKSKSCITERDTKSKELTICRDSLNRLTQVQIANKKSLEDTQKRLTESTTLVRSWQNQYLDCKARCP